MPRAVTISLRVVGVVLDLDPQPAHVGVDEAAVAEVLVAPHPLEQLVARQHRAGVVGELAQQAELGLGEAQLVAALQHDALLAAQLDVAEPRRPRRRGRRLVQLHPAQQRPGSGRPAPWARPAW